MAPSVSLTEDIIMAGLRTFLLSCVPAGVEVFQGQANRVVEPAGTDFIVMTPTMRERLSTNLDTWPKTTNPDHMDRSHSSQITVQLDIHGPNGSDYALVIATLFRDDYGCDAMQAAGITPYYATDGQQMPFINAENQYENRWTMKLTLSSTAIVSTPQDFAATLAATLRPVI